MKDNLTIIKEMLASLNTAQLIDLKNNVDVAIMNNTVTYVMFNVQKSNSPVAKDVPQSILPIKIEPQKIIWKAAGEKWTGRDARVDEEGWTFAENDPELSKFLAENNGASRVKLDGVEFDVKFSGTDGRFLSRSLPKTK